MPNFIFIHKLSLKNKIKFRKRKLISIPIESFMFSNFSFVTVYCCELLFCHVEKYIKKKENVVLRIYLFVRKYIVVAQISTNNHAKTNICFFLRLVP